MTILIVLGTSIRRRIESLANLVARLLQTPIDFLAGFLRVHFSVMKHYAGIVFCLFSRLARLFTCPLILARRTRGQNKCAKYQNRQFHIKDSASERPTGLR
jgi:hypothetical protein